MVCPHSVIRIKVYDSKELEGAPATFKSTAARDKEWAGMKYTIQVAPEDCTGCAICVDICPVKNKQETRLKAINMAPQPPLRVPERDNWDFFLKLPELDRRKIKVGAIRSAAGSGAALRILRSLLRLRRNALPQASVATLRRPRLDRQRHRLLFHLRRQSAHHALGKNSDGRGPAWSNSLFEDNAEFGLGFRLSIDKQTEFARELVKRRNGNLGDELINGLLNSPQKDESDIYDQRQRVDSTQRQTEKHRHARRQATLAARRHAG